MGKLTDAQLYLRMRSNDQAALEEIYDRYERLVYSFAYRMTQNTQMAEDTVQEVFIKLWKEHAPYTEDKGKFSSWLLTMTRNTSLDALRKKGKQQEVGLLDKDAEQMKAPINEMPEQMLEWKEKGTVLRKAIERLKIEQRTIVELFYFHGLSQESISTKLDIPLGTVKSRIRLALQHLRKHLEKERGMSPNGPSDV
ncbi:RNA polymerase sigma factor [Paenisporosarcina antarctica]|uniref:Sigma-70 family RNA polymerase sigma factor n=1 Tax=Paenisporosarcina antarctica TaxID=417367 RepID=A0A4P6ZUH0_9BACL|nr:sigma-70 family RNA polymerase sigma factor [Paenisporosarcina antarctica]QBP39971.1 sigma-70 family RNA polymerase sigma factor [Paenisporosarcina antarctica]